MEITLESTKVEVFDQYGHYGEPGKVVEETLQLRNVGTGIDAFTVIQIHANGRESVQVPPTTSDDAYDAFDLMCGASIPECVR